MGSNFRQDKIGALSEAGGTISLAPSILTIGGRQLETTSLINVALPVMVANTRYQIFAVQSAGVVSLVISSNENSVGPAGEVAWKLVGSFYSDGLSSVGFGSFLTISEAPTSNWIAHDTSFTSSGGGAVTLNATGASQPWMRWRRHGDSVEVGYGFKNGSGGAASGAAGGVKFLLPATIAYSNESAVSDLLLGNYVGSAHLPAVVTPGAGAYFIYSLTDLSIGYNTTNPVQVGNITANFAANAQAKFSVTGWSNTPIEDL